MEELTSNPGINLLNPGTYVILEGAAEPVEHPKNLNYKTDLKGIIEFCSKRELQYNWTESTLIVNTRGKTINLLANDRDQHGSADVIGKLMYSELLTRWKINTGQHWSLKKLRDFIRFNRMYFYHRELAASILKNLSSFHAKVTTEIEQSNDLKGNKKVLFDQKVMHDLELSFTLWVPIFEGMDKTTLNVEINFDIEEGAPVFWMESVELEEKENDIWEREIHSVFESIPDAITILTMT